MDLTWGSFQSAIQLVDGMNIALFALPTVRLSTTTAERRRWESLLSAVPLSQPTHATVRYAFVRFVREQRNIEGRDPATRSACLVAAAITTPVLLWAAQFANDKAHLPIAWLTVRCRHLPGPLAFRTQSTRGR
jgi:hypothetical protein